MPPARACQIIYQVATALEEAHKHNLVHRDIKPSNILLTAEDQAKLLDFGLVMHFRSRMTEPGVVLGTIDFMAPEQARDASSVDVRADIYSLGATFFWCLTGQTPFPAQENLMQDLVARMTRPAPSVCSLRPDLAPELDAVVARMMALKPADRYPTPQAVTRALLRFIERDSMLHHAQSSLQHIRKSEGSSSDAKDRDGLLPVPPSCCLLHPSSPPDPDRRRRGRHTHPLSKLLAKRAMECDVAADGPAALQTLAGQPYDLVLLDVNMPGMTGLELVRRIRASPPCANLKLVMFSGHMNPDEMAQLLNAGLDDFLGKPFSGVQLLARIKACLRHKEAEDRSDRLANLLLTVNAELEKNLLTRRRRTGRHPQRAGTGDGQDRGAAAHADVGSSAAHAALLPGPRGGGCPAAPLRSVIDRDFIEMLACCVPLHDIGMVAVPDHILLKPDKLTDEDRILMEQHTTIGANALQELAGQHGSLVAFMQMAGDICQHHHERFDGTGYPNQLKGDAIPLSARLAALADVYDALRSRRVSSAGHVAQIGLADHEGAVGRSIRSVAATVFERCGPRFEAIFRESGD